MNLNLDFVIAQAQEGGADTSVSSEFRRACLDLEIAARRLQVLRLEEAIEKKKDLTPQPHHHREE